jgi:hypothetical protein
MDIYCMPRVTHVEHVRRYRFLHTAWCDLLPMYGYLSSSDQGAIHQIYRPSHQLTEAELVRHLAAMRGSFPRTFREAGVAALLLERLFVKASLAYGVSDREATRALKTAYTATVADPHSRDGHLLSPGVSGPIRLRGKPARLILRAVRRPEPDFAKLRRATIELASEMRQQERTDAAG